MTSYLGSSWQNRVERVRAELKKNNCGAIVLSALDDVAWLLNLRGQSPINHFYLTVLWKDTIKFDGFYIIYRKFRKGNE